MDRVLLVNLRNAALLWLLSVIVAIITRMAIGAPWMVGAEALILLALLLWLGTRRELLEVLRSAGRWTRPLLVTFVAGLLAAQLVDRSRGTFPLAAWGMYTRSNSGEVRLYEFTAVHESGVETELPLGKGVLRSQLWLFDRTLAAATAATGRSGGQTSVSDFAKCDRLLRALVVRYARRRGEDDTMIALNVWRRLVSVKAGVDSAPRVHVRRVSLQETD